MASREVLEEAAHIETHGVDGKHIALPASDPNRLIPLSVLQLGGENVGKPRFPAAHGNSRVRWNPPSTPGVSH
jgi:hypothetical protein